MSDKITDLIFLGHNPLAEYNIKLLHAKIDEAIVMLGGIQQPVWASSEEDIKIIALEEKEDRKNLEDLVAEIALGLSGKKIQFLEENTCLKDSKQE